MKKLLIFTGMIILLFSACTKDKQTVASDFSTLIVGKWNEDHLTIEYVPAVNPKEEYVIPPGYVVEFGANGKVYVTDGQAAPVYDGEWTIDNKTLNYGPNVCNIVQLTSTKLVYTQEVNYPNYKTISTYSFTRK